MHYWEPFLLLRYMICDADSFWVSAIRTVCRTQLDAGLESYYHFAEQTLTRVKVLIDFYIVSYPEEDLHYR
jgi:hypothetical protein